MNWLNLEKGEILGENLAILFAPEARVCAALATVRIRINYLALNITIVRYTVLTVESVCERERDRKLLELRLEVSVGKLEIELIEEEA